MEKQHHPFNPNKITLVLFFAFFLSANTLLAQEPLSFIAERETMVFGWHRNEFITVNPGDRIRNAEAGYGEAYRYSGELHLLIVFGTANDRFTGLAKYFRPEYTSDLFGADLFINYPMDHADTASGQLADTPITIGDTDEMWVPVQYRDILLGRNRDTLLALFPAVGFLSQSVPGGIIPWYENTQADIQHGRAMFYNSVIRLGTGTHLGVRNIRRANFGTNFGYIVESVISILDVRHTPWPLLATSAFWNTYSPGDAVTLLLYIDGEYLDIFTAGSNLHIGTFIRVKREFIAQYQSLIRANISELASETAQIRWPRRSNGSMEFPPLASIPLSSPSHRTRTELRLREHPNTASRIITTLHSGTGVQVLEVGHSSEIGIVIAPWVKVVCANGYTGWVFSAYLEILRMAWQPELTQAMPAVLAPGVIPSVFLNHGNNALPLTIQTIPAPHISQSNITTDTTLLRFLIVAIVGWVIAVSIGLLLFLSKRKR